MPSIRIKIDEFQYPTREVLQKIRLDMPQLKTLDFPYVYEIIELINNIESMEELYITLHKKS
ncbi:MAG: hypothetical protein V4456_11175 [Bacteroidota bacterium]